MGLQHRHHNAYLIGPLASPWEKAARALFCPPLRVQHPMLPIFPGRLRRRRELWQRGLGRLRVLAWGGSRWAACDVEHDEGNGLEKAVRRVTNSCAEREFFKIIYGNFVLT